MAIEKNVRRVKTLEPTKEVGVHYRFLVMTGKDKGVSYYLLGKRIVVGRSEKADIQILDAQASREHFEVVKVGESYVLTDLKSQNGVIINDLKTFQHALVDGDKIIVGKVVFKLNIIKNIETFEEEKIDENLVEHEDDIKVEDKGKKRRMILIVIIILLVLYVFDDEESGVKVSRKKLNKSEKDFLGFGQDLRIEKNKKLKFSEDKKLNNYLHQGIREYREGNLYRALNEFKYAQTINPENGRAAFYIRKVKKNILDQVKALREHATRDEASLRYRAAIVKICDSIKLLKSFDDKEEEIQTLKKRISDIVEKNRELKEDEVNCTKAK